MAQGGREKLMTGTTTTEFWLPSLHQFIHSSTAGDIDRVSEISRVLGRQSTICGVQEVVHSVEDGDRCISKRPSCGSRHAYRQVAVPMTLMPDANGHCSIPVSIDGPLNHVTRDKIIEIDQVVWFDVSLESVEDLYHDVMVFWRPVAFDLSISTSIMNDRKYLI